ncbi:MAG TPA: transporter [Bacteroidia bacterium]|nr:transporter [Bacteroidia bacterium]
MKRPSLPLLFGATLALAGTAESGDPKSAAATETPDKSGYTPFNPTPRELWRDLSPDRPDATESPVTVDAGAWVVEASYLDWRRDKGDETFTTMSTNLKVGLDNRTDLQLVFDTYTWENPATGTGAEGFGDVQVRLKHNLWGNEGGNSAFAVFPFVKIPTGTALSNGKVEGGLILPFAMDLADGIGLGLMAEIDAVHDDVSGGYDAEFVHSAVLGFDLTDRLGLYTEYIGVAGPSAYQAYFSGGLTLSLTDDLVLDWGTQVGLNDAAEDIGVFGGFTRRF